MTLTTTNLLTVPGLNLNLQNSCPDLCVTLTFYFLLTVKNHFFKPSIEEICIDCAQLTESKVGLDLLAWTWAGSPIQRLLPKRQGHTASFPLKSGYMLLTPTRLRATLFSHQSCTPDLPCLRPDQLSWNRQVQKVGRSR